MLFHSACRKWTCDVSPQREQPDCSSLRASRDHRFIVGPLRARRMVRLLHSCLSEAARCASTEGHQSPIASLVLFFLASLPLVRKLFWIKRVTGLPLTARVQRGPSEAARCASKNGNRLSATSFCARPSTLLPPSLSSAHRPSPAPAPSQLQGAAAETFRQTLSCALPLL